MGRGGVNIRVTGVDEVLSRLGAKAAQELTKDIDEKVERATRNIANEAADGAPVKTGKLASSIPPSVDKVSEMTWEFGSDVEYATRQEYEHAAKKWFFRKAVWNGREPLRKDINEVIRGL